MKEATVQGVLNGISQDKSFLDTKRYLIPNNIDTLA